MKTKIEQRLALYNVGVFALVLIVFSTIIYSMVREGFLSDMRRDLVQMADGVVSSIDYNSKTDEEPLPDLIVSELPNSASASLMDMRLQWFRANGSLAIEKGNFELQKPLNVGGGFEFQAKPKAIIYTKLVRVEGKLLGYARVAQPMVEFDRLMNYLRDGLVLGVLAASAVSGIGIRLLISKSMQPIYDNIQALKQFTADASHELRTPVTAIRTNSSVALKYADGMRESDREKFETILSSSRQMGGLIEDMLKLENSESHIAARGEQQSSRNVGAIFADTRSVLSWLQREKEIELVEAIGADLKAKASDEDILLILQNLYENALRYTPRNGKVTVSAKRDGSFLDIRISDTGIGIAENDLTKVFDRFWRADKARTKAEGGSGLGLAITKNIVERLGGSITVVSELGKGSVFKVRLPAADI